MSTIVNIVFQNQEHSKSPVTETVVRTVVFDSDKEGEQFANNFREQFIYDGTESRYVAKLVKPIMNETFEIMYKLTISYGRYLLEHELVTNSQIESNPAMLATRNGQYSAFALLKNGEVLELEGGNVGIHTFYTINHDLAVQLNEETV